ncbi:Fic/DOC family protein (plasmid) [Xanthomonas campestris pv. passiflorae]|uniref:Fic/DOC family protein n=1 Tax=Xanthomonas TaxID=338 RepID=UPI001CBB4092|nr:Fic family protein [Xanthomonas arboricola]MBV6816158.1 Fic family protein [Xanthomonas campestris pv. passiflorae]MDN0293308.1 Fic family protein [Xanthomonas arboricola pv. pruni]
MTKPIDDPYLDPQTGVLKNRAGITDAATLKQHEAMWASAGSVRWASRPEANSYDLDHLQKIHARLYGETYEWAGKTRTTDKDRNGIAHTTPQQIDANAKALFAQLQAEKKTLDKAAPEAFAQRAGHYMGELTKLEPFREGSIRTQQVFMSQMARDAGYNIEWHKVDRVQMAFAQTKAMEGNYKPFEAIFKDHLKERSIEARAKDGRQDKDVIAVQAIQKNRDSLDRMERSYPGTAQKTHAEISTARVMLNSLEYAVRNKSPEVALTHDPSAPSKTKEFQAIPVHISSKNSLVMVKQSIHAVERAGTTVHHELSQQWHSKRELQVGHEKA